MKKTDEKKLQDFAELKNIEKGISLNIKALQPGIVEIIKNEGFTSLKTPDGMFTLAKYPTYQYSKSTQKLEAQLKVAQATERMNGKAKVVSESEGVRFTSSLEQ